MVGDGGVELVPGGYGVEFELVSGMFDRFGIEG